MITLQYQQWLNVFVMVKTLIIRWLFHVICVKNGFIELVQTFWYANGNFTKITKMFNGYVNHVKVLLKITKRITSFKNHLMLKIKNQSKIR